MNKAYQQLQEKSNQIGNSTNQILALNQELKIANEKIIELARKKGALDYIVKGRTGFDELDSTLKKHFSLKN